MKDGVIDSGIPTKPKKVGWTNKHCVLCKKHERPFKSHNMCNCCCFNKNGTLIKNHGGASRPQPTKKGPVGMNFMQWMRTKIKKALCKHMHKDKKCCMCEVDSDSQTNEVPEGMGWVALGIQFNIKNVK